MPGRSEKDDQSLNRLLGPVGLLLVIMMIGAVWIMFSTASLPQLSETPAISADTNADEGEYLAYVTPRLDALIEDNDEVATLVEERSRNIIMLAQHGNRIETVVEDLEQYADEHTVPPRFEQVHDDILAGGTEVVAIIDSARSAMLQFDFTSLPELLDRFEDASEALTGARDELETLSIREKARLHGPQSRWPVQDPTSTFPAVRLHF